MSHPPLPCRRLDSPQSHILHPNVWGINPDFGAWFSSGHYFDCIWTWKCGAAVVNVDQKSVLWGIRPFPTKFTPTPDYWSLNSCLGMSQRNTLVDLHLRCTSHSSMVCYKCIFKAYSGVDFPGLKRLDNKWRPQGITTSVTWDSISVMFPHFSLETQVRPSNALFVHFVY